MTIIYKKTFENQLLHIINHIAKDKIGASIGFANELEELIFLIPDNPFKYKPSIYFDNKNIRDMTYKGYTINYKVNFDKNLIEVLRIFNRNKPSR
ncbi:type II toxin-antitoxin system RelE/ParE family toxin [Sulfurovum sp. bin170]|uniref:type II toxin-antitoxin system RelE/ParE family toxin n=1 Tax=Sulfurovum sp. bin170 TaxID=2695268 RepID=UPI0013DFF390|nr:type II toxin-antitoxin system RelE/ParE family toxin [Sulfurovum sp. bin170]NEW60790.1 type II toxin-antitoxin system RelE/ParE family toxin [Sulfurovum sp. bin170]